MAVDVAHGTAHPEVGPPISGSPAGLPGPLFYYLTALPNLFSIHPRSSAYLIALLNVAGLALMGAAVKTSLGARARLIYLGLTFASPWTIVYADRIWPGNLFFFLCAVVVFALVRMEGKKQSRAVGVLALTLVAGMQIHLSIAHFWFFSILTLLVIRPRINVRWLVGGTLIGCLAYVPYLRHEMHTDFANTKLILHYAPGGPRSWETLGDLFLYFFAFPTTDIAYLIRDGYWHGFGPIAFWRSTGVEETSAIFASVSGSSILGTRFFWAWQLASVALVVAGIPLLVLTLRRRGANPRRRALTLSFVFASLLGIPVLYWLSRKGGYAHYVTIIAPLAFLPSTVALDCLFSHVKLSALAAVYVVGFPFVALDLTASYYRRSGSPVTEQIAVMRFIESKTDGRRPFRLDLALRGGYPQSYSLLTKKYLNYPWNETRAAQEVFTVTFSRDTPPASDELRLDHITVRKTR